MLTNQFTRRFISIGGRAIPGLQVSEARTESVPLPSGKVILAQFADILTLRETNPDGDNPGVKYLALTPENLRFSTLRFTNVEGLDVEDGALLSIEELEARRLLDIQTRQTATLANRAPAVVASGIDLSSDEDEDKVVAPAV